MQAKYDINGPRYNGKEFFTYDAALPSNVTLAPAGSQDVAIQINGDSDFFWTKLTTFALVASDGTTRANDQLPAVTIQITNETSGRKYSNNAVPLADVAGTAQLPFILPIQTVFEAKSTITIKLVNVSDNITYSQLYLDFHGVKAYLAGGQS